MYTDIKTEINSIKIQMGSIKKTLSNSYQCLEGFPSFPISSHEVLLQLDKELGESPEKRENLVRLFCIYFFFSDKRAIYQL